jgi:hypothetical protein
LIRQVLSASEEASDDCTIPWPQILDFFGTPLVIEPSPGQLSSDAGLLPIRQLDRRIGLTGAFADALDDPRDPDLSEHTFLEMVRSRVYGILAGHEGRNGHDTLRTDPVFKLVSDRSPEGDDLASQPTLSRFEHAISIRRRKLLCDVFPDPFIASFGAPPAPRSMEGKDCVPRFAYIWAWSGSSLEAPQAQARP